MDKVYHSEELNKVYHILRNVGLTYLQSITVIKELQKIEILPKDKKE